MSSSGYKILWVQDDLRGPFNGVLETPEGTKVWFSREDTTQISAAASPAERSYLLYELSEDHLQQLTKNHEEACAITGAPLKHGDPRIIKRKVEMRTKDESTKEEGKEYDAQFRTLLSPVSFKHNGQGLKIMQNMQKRGIDPRAMRAEFLKQQNALKGIQKHEEGETQKAILITASRQLRCREIPTDKSKHKTVIAGALHCENPVELSCSRLAVGPLEGLEIRIWYDDNANGKNKRASKLVGFDVANEILVMVNDHDLSEEDFLTVEKMLVE